MHDASDTDSGGEANLRRVPAALDDVDARSLAYNQGGIIPNEGPEANTHPGDLNYRDLFFKYTGLAIKYRWMIAGICVVALVGGSVVTLMSIPMYRATVTIQIDREPAKVVKIDLPNASDDGGDTARFYQTQYDILKSRSLAERVAENIDLQSFFEPASPSPWAKLWSTIFPAKPGGERNLAHLKAAAAAEIQGGLTIAPALNSRLVKISFDSPAPDWAQKIANAAADNFIDANLERRYGATTYARSFLKDRLDELKLKLEESERALVSYAEREEIIASKGQPSAADSDLVALQSALQQVKTERIRAEEQWSQAQKSKGIPPQILLADKSIQNFRDKRALLAADYQDKLSFFKADYPDMRKLKGQIDQIDKEIEAAANVIRSSLKSQYESLKEHEVLLRKNIDETRAKVLEARNKSIQLQILQREADTNRSLYDGLLQQYKDIGVAGAVSTNNVAIIDRAERPGAPFKPSLQRNLALSLLLGLFAAAGAIAVREIVDDTFKAPEEIEQQLGLPVLGIIPKIETDLIEDIKNAPTSIAAEAFRSFRTALQFSTNQGAPKTLLVTSARPGEGKSTTSAGLAINLTQLGMKVLLIDADLRNPSAHRHVRLGNETGLANYLAGMSIGPDLFQQTSIPGLSFISSGPLPPNPAELLAGPKMLTLLSFATEKYDAVIIDAPPVLGLADTPLIASIAAGTLVVLGAGETRRAIVRGALKRLYFARARIIGAVFNKFDFRATGYGYGYGYGYGQGAVEHFGYGTKTVPQLGRASGA